MDHVLVRVKGLRKKPILKLISDHTLFDNIDLNSYSYVEYSPDHNLDEDSWFKIESFSSKSFCIDMLKSQFDSKNYDDLKRDQFSKIAYLCAVQNGDFFFQKVTPSLFVRKKTIMFGELAVVESVNNRLVVNSQPDAIYFTSDDLLIFRDLAAISSIFNGIDELFKEATNEEVQQFLDESFIVLADGYCTDKVSKPNRKRVALAMATLSAMSDQDKSEILSYITKYCGEKLESGNDGKFKISTDTQLKLLIYGIEQRFYTTPLGQEKRIANSVQSFDS